MVRNLYLYKCGTTYKAVSIDNFFKQVNHNIQKCAKEKSNNEKMFHNLIRAKTTIKDLILSNDFYFFVTLTINNNHDRFDLDNIRKSINNKIRRTRCKFNLELKFLLVPEKHKNGAYHLHGVFSKEFISFMYINKNKYLSCDLFDYLGFSSVEIIYSKERASSYILKYITKDFHEREIGKHLYFASQNLNKPELITSYKYKDDKFDITLFKNDYCLSRYFDEKPKLPLRLIK